MDFSDDGVCFTLSDLMPEHAMKTGKTKDDGSTFVVLLFKKRYRAYVRKGCPPMFFLVGDGAATQVKGMLGRNLEAHVRKIFSL